MSQLVFPEHISVEILEAANGRTKPYAGAELVFWVRAFARQKNDYNLGPFFSSSAGLLTITRRQLELHVAAVVDAGVMDYAPVEGCSPLVEIVHATSEEVARLVDARSRVWITVLRAALSNKGMKLTKLRTAPVRQAEVPSCARAARLDAGTASQLIPGVRRTNARRVG